MTPPLANPPSSPSDCRSWQDYTDDSGTPFTSKAECLAYLGLVPPPHHGHQHHGHRGHGHEGHGNCGKGHKRFRPSHHNRRRR